MLVGLQLGTQLANAGEYQKLFDVLQEGVNLDMPDVDRKFWLYYNRGVAALILDKHMQAIFHLSVAISLKGDAWSPLMCRCEAYEAIGDYPAAAKVTFAACPAPPSPPHIYIACKGKQPVRLRFQH